MEKESNYSFAIRGNYQSVILNSNSVTDVFFKKTFKRVPIHTVLASLSINSSENKLDYYTPLYDIKGNKYLKDIVESSI